jgi:hypothetical protein
MTDWISMDRKKAEQTRGALPNPAAPRLVKATEALGAAKRPKKNVLLKIDGNLHAQLSQLALYDKLAGVPNAALTSMFLQGLDLYLKKRKLPGVEELMQGRKITQDMAC